MKSKKQKKMENGKVVLSVLAGVAAGALLGVLFAPAKGSETRKKIAEKSKDYTDALKEKYEELMKTMSEKFAETKEDAGDLAEEGKSKLDGIKKEINNSMSY